MEFPLEEKNVMYSSSHIDLYFLYFCCKASIFCSDFISFALLKSMILLIFPCALLGSASRQVICLVNESGHVADGKGLV